MEPPETRYAKSGDVHIAYQVIGTGPFDLIWIPPGHSNVELRDFLRTHVSPPGWLRFAG